MALSEKRQGRVTGSQAGAILGLCPWRSREDVINDWLYGSSFTGNVATEHGNFYEEYAIADLAIELGVTLEPNEKFFIHQHLDWLGATPDVVGSNFICEIKCPYGKRKVTDPSEFKSIHDQPHYYAQVQIEMHCTDKRKAYFYQWSPSGASKLEVVEKDREWLYANLPTLRAFIADVEERRKTMTDDELLAGEYLYAKKRLDAVKEELDKIKEEMIDKANGSKRKFGPVSVYPVSRKGSIPYSKVVKELLPDVDLEPYRGEPSTSWVVK